ncbi:rpoB [Acrasis kona]|uniref:RpoB n=1 Tax=Acrasis kona TaxID=1008807 RepID=A0AAW2Z493_9EUKA
MVTDYYAYLNTAAEKTGRIPAILEDIDKDRADITMDDLIQQPKILLTKDSEELSVDMGTRCDEFVGGLFMTTTETSYLLAEFFEEELNKANDLLAERKVVQSFKQFFGAVHLMTEIDNWYRDFEEDEVIEELMEMIKNIVE